MKKRFWIAFLLTLCILVGMLSACGGGDSVSDAAGDQSQASTDSAGTSTDAGEEEVYEMIVSSHVTENFYFVDGYKAFCEYVEEASNGRIKCKQFYGGTLTLNDTTSKEMVTSGAIQLSQADYASCGTYNNDLRMTAAVIPRYWNQTGDNDRLYYFLDNSELMQDCYEKLEKEKNIKVMGFYSGGRVGLCYTGDRVEGDLSNVKGLKVRCAEQPNDMAVLTGLGPNATPMALSDAFTGIQQGTVDGVFTNVSTMVDYEFVTVCDYLLDLNAWTCIEPIMLDANFYNSLPADLQKIVDEGCEILEKICRERCVEVDVDSLAAAEAAGCEVIPIEGALAEDIETRLAAVAEERKATLDPDFVVELEAEMEKLFAEYDAQNQ